MDDFSSGVLSRAAIGGTTGRRRRSGRLAGVDEGAEIFGNEQPVGDPEHASLLRVAREGPEVVLQLVREDGGVLTVTLTEEEAGELAEDLRAASSGEG
jgi:hypothetical protein